MAKDATVGPGERAVDDLHTHPRIGDRGSATGGAIFVALARGATIVAVTVAIARTEDCSLSRIAIAVCSAITCAVACAIARIAVVGACPVDAGALAVGTFADELASAAHAFLAVARTFAGAEACAGGAVSVASTSRRCGCSLRASTSGAAFPVAGALGIGAVPTHHACQCWRCPS